MLDRSYYGGDFAYELMELYTALDTSIIEAMARRIAKTGRVTNYSKWQAEVLQDAGLLYEDIIRLIGEQTGMSDAYLRQTFEDAGVESISFDNSIYEAAGLEPMPLRQSPAMMNLLRAGLQKTGGSLRNLTMTTANTAQTAYINACNLAYMQTSSGAMSYTEAIRAAVKTAAKQGTTVLYPSGHQDQLDVAVRRSVLTGVSQTCAVIAMENAKEMGCDLMEITAHAGARPEHAAWQGKIVSLSGRKGYLTLADIGYGSVTGFKGANCRHDWYPFFEGISTRLYSDRQLEELGKSDLYDLQQGQRAMERQIRATKRELAGYDAAMSAADEDTAKAIKQDFDATAVKLKKQESALKEHCRSNGLLEDSSRVQTMYGDNTTQGFGRSISQKAVWANRKVSFSTPIVASKRTQYQNYLLEVQQNPNRLRRRQVALFKQAPLPMNWAIVQGRASIRDLAALTAYCGDEFALFGDAETTILIHGTPSLWNIPAGAWEIIRSRQLTWIAHSHPTTENLMPSREDIDTLRLFTWQEKSDIIDLNGNTITFYSDFQWWINFVLGVRQ